MNEENKDLNITCEQEDTAQSENPSANEASAQAEKSKAKADKKHKAKKKGKGKLKTFLKSRKARNGSVAAAIVAVVIVIAVILNIVANLLTDRFPNLKIDMTANGTYALQENTIDYMSKLDKEVTVTVLMSKKDFESGGTYLAQANALLEKMQSSSGGKLKLEYVDLSQNPTFTSKYPDADWTDSSQNYVLVVECGEQYRVLKLSDCFEYDEQTYYYYGTPQITATKIEQAVVTAALNVTTDDKTVVNVIKGNQEQDYSAIVSLLENNAYKVDEVSLATGDIDENAKIVLLYAPSVDLDTAAVDKISAWLDNDGKYGRTLIFVPTADMPKSPNLEGLLNEWGMEIDSGYVFETDREHLISNSTPYAFILEYTDYYKDGLKNPNIPVAVTDSHAINVTDESKAHGILITSDNAGIYPLEADENWNYNDAVKGEPINIAAEGVKSNADEAASKLVVFGSYTMFSQGIMSYNSYNNSAYLLNLANTVADKDDAGIVIESKQIDSSELGVTDVATKSAVMVIFVIIVPVAVIIIGIVVWLRRRNK